MEMKPDSSLPMLARLAGAFLLASGFFALAALVAFGTYGQQTPAGYAFALGGFLSLAAWLMGRAQSRKWHKSAPRDRFSRQRTLLGFNAVASVALLGTVLIGANYLATRRHKTFDLTQNRINSLSDQTLQILAKLPAPLRLTYFYASRQIDPSAQSLLDAYARASDKVRVESVSALREPSRVPPSFNGAPLLVAQLERDGKAAPKQEVSVADEQNLSSALLKLLEPKARTLYFLSGHGEVAPTQIPELQSALETQNYNLKTLSLLSNGAKIPADAAALVIMAPQVDLGAREAQILSAYFAQKGRLIFLLSPARQKLPRFEALLKSWSAIVGSGAVFDDQQAYQSPQLPVGVRGDGTRHPILRGVAGDVVFPGAVPLRAAPNAQGFTPLFQSSNNSQAVLPDGKSAARGPFVLAAAIERGQSRAVISSSASLATAEGLRLFGNQSFVLSSVNWAVGNDALVSIPPKTPLSTTLQMPDATARFAAIFSVVVLPLLALAIGAAVWWKRR